MRELLQAGNQGLTREELTEILRQAPREAAAREDAAPDNQARMLERIEHLETIVTSEDWDFLQVSKESSKRKLVDLDSEQEAGAEQRAENITRRVR